MPSKFEPDDVYVYTLMNAKPDERNVMLVFTEDKGKKITLKFTEEQLNTLRKVCASTLSELSKENGNQGFVMD